MAQEQLEEQLRRLVLGLTDQAIVAGDSFHYDGGSLHADEVADIALPSVLCLAQDLSVRTGVGSFGYQFQLGSPSPVFPLEASLTNADASFSSIAPFVSEVFRGEVMECRHDLSVLFEAAAQLVRPGFMLGADTNYTIPMGSDSQLVPDQGSQPETSWN